MGLSAFVIIVTFVVLKDEIHAPNSCEFVDMINSMKLLC